MARDTSGALDETRLPGFAGRLVYQIHFFRAKLRRTTGWQAYDLDNLNPEIYSRRVSKGKESLKHSRLVLPTPNSQVHKVI